MKQNETTSTNPLAKAVRLLFSAITSLGYRPILSNLGFLFQISGIFTLPSILFAFYISETDAAISLLITALVFLGIGFALNALSERKNLNLRQSCALLFLFYLFVTLINCTPYLYLQIFKGSILDQLFNGWFETISASSTTGITLMEGIVVPQSIKLARSLSEWVGGLGIVFILLSSFYPSERLSQYSKALGFERLTGSYKGTFFTVLLIYAIYTLIFSFLLMITGLDAFTAFHTTFTVISTTGVTLVSASTMPLAAVVVITLMMLLSAFSFVFHFKLFSIIANIDWKRLFSRNVRRFLLSIYRIKWKELFSLELKLYLVLLVIFTFMLWGASGINPFQSFYHVVDFSSSCGLGVVDFQGIGEPGKIILVFIMFIGPMSFSIGGGIRILRAFVLGKFLLASPKTFLSGKLPKIKLEGDEVQLQDALLHLLIIAMFAITAIGAAWILTNYDYTFGDAMVESVSAITTTGDSPKVLTPLYPVIPKLTLMILMLLGRIEIIPIFVALTKEEPAPSEPGAAEPGAAEPGAAEPGAAEPGAPEPNSSLA